MAISLAGNSQYPLCYYSSSSTSLNKISAPWACLIFFLQSGHNLDVKKQACGLCQEPQHHKLLFSAGLCCQHTFWRLLLKRSLYSEYRTVEDEDFSNMVLIMMDTLRCCLNTNGICKLSVRRGGKKCSQYSKQIILLLRGFPTSV